MIDHRFGKLLDELDAQDRWDTTAMMVCTRDGHDLGDVRSTGGDCQEKGVSGLA